MRKNVAIILLLTCLIFTFLGGGIASSAFADEVVYTSPLADLQRDETFNIADYPLVPGDVSIDVIQIAESSDRELFVYVYQPSGEIVTVSSINISSDNLTSKNRYWHKFALKLLSVENSIGKYLVEGFKVSADDTRYYDISSLSRLPLENEETTAEGNLVEEISYEVGKLFTLQTTLNGEVLTSEAETQVVTLYNQYCGTLAYFGGIGLEAFFQPFYADSSYVLSHYVAFSTDWDIDQLYEADVTFVTRQWIGIGLKSSVTLFPSVELFKKTMENRTYGDSVDNFVTVTYKECLAEPNGGVFHYKFEMDKMRITSADDFVKEEELKSDVKANILERDWVLRFHESELKTDIVNTVVTGQYAMVQGEDVSSVSVLRLKFLCEGRVYNLGVVSNTQTGSGDVDNTDSGPLAQVSKDWDKFVKQWESFWNKVGDFFTGVGKFFQKYWWILVAVGVLIALGILSIFFPVLRVVFKVIWIGIKWLLKILWYIVSAPVRLVVMIVNKTKERKEGG